MTARNSVSRAALVSAFAALYLCWGSTYLAIRWAVEEIPPFLMAGFRFLIAGALLYAWARARGAARPTVAQWRATALIGGLLLVGGNGCVVLAERSMASGLAALMISTTPLWMVGLDWAVFRSATQHRGTVAGLVLGFLGMVLLASPGGGVPSTGAGGALLLTFATVSWSLGSLLARRVSLPPSPTLASAMEMLTGGAMLVAAGSAWGEWGGFHPGSVSGRALAYVGFLVVFGSLVGFSSFVWLNQVTTPAQVSTYAYVNPVVAVVLGWWLGGETLSGRMWVGAAIIIAAVAAITLTSARPRLRGSASAPRRG